MDIFVWSSKGYWMFGNWIMPVQLTLALCKVLPCIFSGFSRYSRGNREDAVHQAVMKGKVMSANTPS